jgi:DNA-binding LacI/PurR family transcriptional regulator
LYLALSRRHVPGAGAGRKGKSLRTASSDIVLSALYDLIERLDEGARLPTIRDLMKSFRVSQASVQEAFSTLRDEGLVAAQVGRGTYVLKGRGASRKPETVHTDRQQLDSVLILSNSSMNERCALVQNHIVGEMSGAGSKVVQISYHHTGHLLEILNSIPKFDAAILQSHYESIPISLLHLLQDKTRALVVDGHSLSGVDIDRIGTDWEEALEMALRHLSDLGHRAIGLVSLDTMAQPILAVRRAYSRIGMRRDLDLELSSPILLEGLPHPTQSVGKALEEALSAVRDGQGRLPFSAMITVGFSDTTGIRQSLERLELRSPDDLSVYVLGHHDVPTEHFELMTMAGSTYLEAAQQLVGCIRRRLSSPELPPQVNYLECREIIRHSTGAPPRR